MPHLNRRAVSETQTAASDAPRHRTGQPIEVPCATQQRVVDAGNDAEASDPKKILPREPQFVAVYKEESRARALWRLHLRVVDYAWRDPVVREYLASVLNITEKKQLIYTDLYYAAGAFYAINSAVRAAAEDNRRHTLNEPYFRRLVEEFCWISDFLFPNFVFNGQLWV